MENKIKSDNNNFLLSIVKNITKNFLMIFFSILILFFGFNFIFQREESKTIKKKQIESADQIMTNTKHYYIIKFTDDSLYYSVEFTKNKNFLGLSNNINKVQTNSFPLSVSQKKENLNSTTTAASVVITNATAINNNIVNSNFTFVRGDSVIVEYSIKKYPLLLESTQNFKIKGYNAKLYSNF
jgi:hypothetical protein